MPRISTALPLLIGAAMILFNQKPAQASVITFETFPDGTAILDSTPITTQFTGLTFSHTTVITAGISLDELEFPPTSGTNVIFDDGGTISISFSIPVFSFGAYFTHAVPLTIDVHDGSFTQFDEVSSAYFNNLAVSGDPGSHPNEYLSIGLSDGISQVHITGIRFGGNSFTMDDIYINDSPASAPEPRTAFLLTSGLLIIISAARLARDH
jgi:hypothetical protein